MARSVSLNSNPDLEERFTYITQVEHEETPGDTVQRDFATQDAAHGRIGIEGPWRRDYQSSKVEERGDPIFSGFDYKPEKLDGRDKPVFKEEPPSDGHKRANDDVHTEFNSETWGTQRGLPTDDPSWGYKRVNDESIDVELQARCDDYSNGEYRPECSDYRKRANGQKIDTDDYASNYLRRSVQVKSDQANGEKWWLRDVTTDKTGIFDDPISESIGRRAIATDETQIKPIIARGGVKEDYVVFIDGRDLSALETRSNKSPKAKGIGRLALEERVKEQHKKPHPHDDLANVFRRIEGPEHPSPKDDPWHRIEERGEGYDGPDRINPRGSDVGVSPFTWREVEPDFEFHNGRRNVEPDLEEIKPTDPSYDPGRPNNGQRRSTDPHTDPVRPINGQRREVGKVALDERIYVRKPDPPSQNGKKPHDHRRRQEADVEVGLGRRINVHRPVVPSKGASKPHTRVGH